MTSLRGASTVVTMTGSGPVRGEEMANPVIAHDQDVLVSDGLIEGVVDASWGRDGFDARGCTVIPGFVDCHTHLPFYGWRADEDAARLTGVRYETLHAERGGIYRSKQMLDEASDDDILAFARGQAAAMLRAGTTTFETKSGYGLSVEAELRQLRLARRLGAEVPQKVVHTCLAAHAIPEGYSAGTWVGEASEALLSSAANEDLCSAVDIYVESFAFALEHAARLAEAATANGMTMRMHADQLEDGQGAAMAARWGFRSADHLNHTSADAAADLGASDTAAVLLPGATYTLRQAKKPPVRTLLRAGAIVALASDLNPGTSPLHSMAFVMSLACRLYQMKPLEALTAATVNAAYVLGLDDSLGRIQPGQSADLVVLDAQGFEEVVYRPDADLVVAVLIDGVPVYVRPGDESRLSAA